MGTRHLTIVKHEDEIKVAQYGQWDGYPDGAGMIILNFLKTADLDQFKERLSLCEWATEEARQQQIEVMRKYTSAKSLPSDMNQKEFLSLEESEMLAKLHPETHRDTGSNILELINVGHFHKRELLLAEGRPVNQKYELQPGKIYLSNGFPFGNDRVFCEWAWAIDLDTNSLEVYCGQFNHDGSKGIFKDFDNPVRLLTSFWLDDLPDEEVFLSQCHPPEVTDEEALEYIAEITERNKQFSADDE